MRFLIEKIKAIEESIKDKNEKLGSIKEVTDKRSDAISWLEKIANLEKEFSDLSKSLELAENKKGI